jgi:hypothetical protein
MALSDYTAMDEALAFLAPYGPDLRNGLTSHAPMAAEALVAMGRPDAVIPWLEGYRDGLLPRRPARERIAPDGWRAALGHEELFPEWLAFFERELDDGSWSDVLAVWTARLGAGFCASATHGVIRVGHAVRTLTDAESAARRRELAEGLAYWAAAYQVLPGGPDAVRPMRPRDAIAAAPLVPEAQRRFTGTIVGSLQALDDFPDFRNAIGLLAVDGPVEPLLSELSETFARVFLANAHDTLTAIVFVHAVTSAAALRSLLPHLDDAAARAAVRYAWQTACALHAAFGRRPPPLDDVPSPRESRAALVDMAIANGDEHAIKFTEACLREHALAPSPAYLAAARRAIDLLGEGGPASW